MDLFDDDDLPPCVGEKFREITHTLGQPDCLHYAVEIERRKAPKDWPAALETVPEYCRDECETYLRGMAARIRAARKAKGQP